MPLPLDRGVREIAARPGLPVGLVLAAELLTWARRRLRHPHSAGLAARTGLHDAARHRSQFNMAQRQISCPH